MPRARRQIEVGGYYHVLNRGNGRQKLFQKSHDYLAFVDLLTEALTRFDVRLLCWCLMPNHWHLVLRPMTDDALPRFIQWLTMTHVRRHHEHYHVDPGHLYQGRYKSFPVENDAYFLTLCRYVESNALRAKLCQRAETWDWSSLHQRQAQRNNPPMAEWPLDLPNDWLELVNEPVAEVDAAQIRISIERNRPLGSSPWMKRIATRLGLQQTFRVRGRPRKPDSKLSERQRRRRRLEDQSPAVRTRQQQN